MYVWYYILADIWWIYKLIIKIGSSSGLKNALFFYLFVATTVYADAQEVFIMHVSYVQWNNSLFVWYLYIYEVSNLFYGVEWWSFSFICIQQVSGTIISFTSSVLANVWVWKLPTGSIYSFVIVFSPFSSFGGIGFVVYMSFFCIY